MIFWGIWGLLSAVASGVLPALMVQVLSSVGLIPVAILLLFSKNLRDFNRLGKGAMAAFAAGVLGGTGNLALFQSLRLEGEASVIIPLSGMYPLVTVIVAKLFLKERINGVQVIGIVLSLVAIYLFSVASSSPSPSSLRATESGWMLYACLALLLFGLSCVAQKVATHHISDELSSIVWTLAMLGITAVVLLSFPMDWQLSSKQVGLALLVGFTMAIANFTLFMAFRWGKASIVTPMTALYPVVTVLLAALLLGERLSPPKLVAILLALSAAVALGYEQQQVAGEISS
jgi:uncharacterized membrane protein